MQAARSCVLFPEWNKFTANWSRQVMLTISLIGCLLSGSALLNPTFLEKEKVWNAQAWLETKQAPTQSMALWNRSLKWDQTQTSIRRLQAEFLLRRGNTDTGLKAVEEVLHWQPLDLKAYEWAQSVVWDAAEVQRTVHPKVAAMLYHWIESVPLRIEGREGTLSPSERMLWQGYRGFQPSPHIRLLAEYARQRQLTQLPPKT